MYCCSSTKTGWRFPFNQPNCRINNITKLVIPGRCDERNNRTTLQRNPLDHLITNCQLNWQLTVSLQLLIVYRELVLSLDYTLFSLSHSKLDIVSSINTTLCTCFVFSLCFEITVLETNFKSLAFFSFCSSAQSYYSS